MSGETIVITGASGGIGAALAERYAEPGTRLALLGRDADRLETVAEACRRAGAEVETALVDVRERERMHEWLVALDERSEIGLLISNAGVSAGLEPNLKAEAEGVSTRLVDINYKGMLNTVEPIAERMRRRGRGHIALVSSVAALRPVPDMPSYSATKAAVRAYGIALRGWLAPFGVTVTVICPGFVTSSMSARHGGIKPFEISAQRAAEIIRRGLTRRKATIAFPWRLVTLTRLGNLFPARLSDWFVKPFRARITPDDGR